MPGKLLASLSLQKFLHHLNGHGNDVGASPSCRDPDCTGKKLHGLSEDIADDRHHATPAIQYRGARGAMIEHEAIVSFVHLEQHRACKLVTIGAVLYESTADGTQ